MRETIEVIRCDICNKDVNKLASLPTTTFGSIVTRIYFKSPHHNANCKDICQNCSDSIMELIGRLESQND